MSQGNTAIQLGRLGADPELRHTDKGIVCNFSIANERVWYDKENNQQKKTNWHRCVVWGRLAEAFCEHLSKGEQVFIEGRLEDRPYEDKNGSKRYGYHIEVESWKFADGRKGKGKGGGSVDEDDTAGDNGSGQPEGEDLPF